MKKTIIFTSAVAVIVIALLAYGCKKTSNPTESWTWKGTTHTSNTCIVGTGANAGTLTVQDASTTLNVIFYNNTLPSSGTYIDTVEAWGNAATPGQITLNLVSGGITYQSTGGDGFNQTVNVTVSNGIVSVSAPQNNPVEMLNIASNSADSAGLYFSIVQ